MNNKVGEFINFICEYKLDVVVLIEIWFFLNELVLWIFCIFVGYKFFDFLWISWIGGGIGVLFRDNLMVIKGDVVEFWLFEYFEWYIKFGIIWIYFIIIYRILYLEVYFVIIYIFFDEFLVFFEFVVFCLSYLLIIGDFNIYIDMVGDVDVIRLCGLFESIGLK